MLKSKTYLLARAEEQAWSRNPDRKLGKLGRTLWIQSRMGGDPSEIVTRSNLLKKGCPMKIWFEIDHGVKTYLQAYTICKRRATHVRASKNPKRAKPAKPAKPKLDMLDNFFAEMLAKLKTLVASEPMGLSDIRWTSEGDTPLTALLKKTVYKNLVDNKYYGVHPQHSGDMSREVRWYINDLEMATKRLFQVIDRLKTAETFDFSFDESDVRQAFDYLGVPFPSKESERFSDATYRSLNNAFRNFSKRHHPDHNPGKDVTNFLNVVTAYNRYKDSHHQFRG
jgi:hypothetical protein